jgi:alkylation response protein AidB-like acyl-CoA dehydrogenase
LFDVKAITGDALVAEAEMAALRPHILARTRLGASAEILGVCERLIEDAITHVKARRQFGQALAEFQAVQHLLAWAATELHQLRCLFDIAVHTHAGAGADPAQAEMVKAVAGRVLHTVTQTVIQVSGAISFTWEYSVNRLHHRGLLLDQVAGSSAQLVTVIGERTRLEQRLDPLVELSALYPAVPSE